MINRCYHALSLLWMAIAVTSCQRPIDTKSTIPAAPSAAEAILSSMNVGSEEITACNGSVPKPTKTIVLTFDKQTDLYSVIRNIDESGTPVPNAGNSADYPTGSTPTPLDFWAQLDDNNNNKRQTVQIKIVLLDTRLKFRNDKYAIVGDKPGAKMLCDLWVSGDRMTATITAKYDHSSPNGKGAGANKTYGSMNIGLMLQQNGGGELPVFVDPIVKNEG